MFRVALVPVSVMTNSLWLGIMCTVNLPWLEHEKVPLVFLIDQKLELLSNEEKMAKSEVSQHSLCIRIMGGKQKSSSCEDQQIDQRNRLNTATVKLHTKTFLRKRAKQGISSQKVNFDYDWNFRKLW